MHKLFVIPFYLLFFLSLSVVLLGQSTLLYKDFTKTAEIRAEDLLRRMTLEEKVSQLQSQLLFLPNYSQRRNYAVGHFRNIAHFMHKYSPATPGTCAAAINKDTRRSIEATRLGIPVLQHGEALHGANWGMTTVFPQCIGIAATFDDSLLFRVGEAVAQELRAVGVRQVYAPVINIARDPRWGRMQETYGEDVYLTSRMGVAYTKALQQGGVIATLKHFVDNYGAGGHDSYASETSWRALRETYLEPFRACIVEGGAGSVMAAYNSVDGTPCSNNNVLLNDILRKEWGFKGTVVSDYGGVNEVYDAHHIVESLQDAEAQCLKAGLDVMLANGYSDLLSLVKTGKIDEKDIDCAVSRVLTAKFQLGIFDHPYVDTSAANEIVRSPAHRELSLETAIRTMTLLKNDHQTLPLDANTVKRIGVFGPAANVLSLGDYTGPYGGWKGKGAITPYQGLLNCLKRKAKIALYEPGMDPVEFAKSCDVLIYFAAIQEGEGLDRSRLTLPVIDNQSGQSSQHAQIVDDKTGIVIKEDQVKMIQLLAGIGIKTIVVLQNGAPIDLHNWINQADAILEAWYPGEQGGTAIAEALFGDINPGGRLPVTWPKHVGQVPIYYSTKPSGRGYDYSDDDGKPEFPFGFGLTYTSFAYSDLQLPETLTKGDSLPVKLKVTNTGTRTGDEVIQVYLHDSTASVVQPIIELKAFKRITLTAGETREVSLILPYGSFGYWDKNLKFVITPGIFMVNIGEDAQHMVLQRQIKID